MCIFSYPVDSVTKTNLLVSFNPTTRRQLVVYSNNVANRNQNNAMILPFLNSVNTRYIPGEVNIQRSARDFTKNVDNNPNYFRSGIRREKIDYDFGNITSFYRLDIKGDYYNRDIYIRK
jgi:hypothetical protein